MIVRGGLADILLCDCQCDCHCHSVCGAVLCVHPGSKLLMLSTIVLAMVSTMRRYEGGGVLGLFKQC